MKIKSQQDFVSGALLVLVGVAFAAGATNYGFGEAARPGPGYFPFGLGVLLAVLGCAISIMALTGETKADHKIGAVPWRPLLCVVGAIVFFGFFLPRLGFLIAFPLMIVITAFASTEFSVKDALLNAAILTTLSYLVFIKGLSLNIPLFPI